MALVDYSDSEEEEVPVEKSVPKTTGSSFKKVVDRSNPGKIKISLPEPLQDPNQNDEHPAKRVKTGGVFSDFKSFLPPPKQRGQPSVGGVKTGKEIGKTGLSPGVSLKTGAAPGFSREVESSTNFTESSDSGLDTSVAGHGGRQLNLPTPKAPENYIRQAPDDVKLVGKPLMFKPLSVARKPVKKKKRQDDISKTASELAVVTPTSDVTGELQETSRKPKVSLFSMPAETDAPIDSSYSGEYQPMIIGANNSEYMNTEPHSTRPDSSSEEYDEAAGQGLTLPIVARQDSQSLTEIASDLKLSTAERRQLFGRQRGPKNGNMPSVTKIINFNTDEEYRHNEELRAAGEIAVHNPVRAIAPGKHSLKQLVNAAQSQKDALEESFAQGKANRAEAGSRYGWK